MSKGINPNIKRQKKSDKSAEEYFRKLTTTDRYNLSDVLTIIESHTAIKQKLAQEILSLITDSSTDTLRIGITGSPGAGKSTLIEQLGLAYIAQGKKVAVLAIDPSSTKSEGSILGDKTRMTQLSNHSDAYVRPTASATHLGGVSKTTSESIAICEQAGYDVIIIESVGVGQSEVALADLVDVYVLVLLPGGGDDVQGIKRGVVEMADILLINKADGDRISLAKQSKKDFEGSVRLFSHELSEWSPPVLPISALQAEGIEDLLEEIGQFISIGKSNKYFSERRENQKSTYIKDQVTRYIEQLIESKYDINAMIHNHAISGKSPSVHQLTQRIISDIAKKLEA